jgi:hypothetical protein
MTTAAGADFPREGQGETRAGQSFDVFVCHNLRDKHFVRQLTAKLRDEGYFLWLDEIELLAGASLLKQIDEAIRHCSAAVVVIGPNGAGAFQLSEEIRRIADTGKPVVPILAPGSTDADAHSLSDLFPDNLYASFARGRADLFAATEWRKVVNGLGRPTARVRSLPRPATYEQSAQSLARLVASGGLAVFVGTTWREGVDDDLHPDAEKLARFLIDQARRADMDPLDFIPSVEEAARIFELSKGTGELDRQAIARFVNPRGTLPSVRFDFLAGCLARLATRHVGNERLKKTPQRKPIVVFSTNIELRLERSLIRSGTPFTRIVVYRGGEKLAAWTYGKVSQTLGGIEVTPLNGMSRSISEAEVHGEPPADLADLRGSIIESLRDQGVPPARFPTLEDVIRSVRVGELLQDEIYRVDVDRLEELFSDGEFPSLFLVKLLGATGVPGSTAVTTGRLLALGDLEKKLPQMFKTALQMEPKLLLGFSPAEPIFQIIYHAFLRDKARHLKTVAVFESFASHGDNRGILERVIGVEKIEAALEEHLGVDVVVASPVQFAQKFIESYEAVAVRHGDEWY